MATLISSTDAARHLGDCLARVKHKGEHFILTKNNQPLAELAPVPTRKTATWKEIRDALAQLPFDPSFADDLEKVRQADRPLKNPWA